MAEALVVSALKHKRAELSGDLLVVQARADKLRFDIAAIDRALSVFDPDAKPSDLTPVIRHRKTETKFRHGSFTESILSILRRADVPMTIRHIAGLIAQEFNLPYEKAHDRQKVINRVRSALVKRRTGVTSEWDGSVTVWRAD